MQIVYGVDRQLREGDTVLAMFDEGEASPWGCVCVGDRRYELARHNRRGWRFRLVDCGTGEDVWEYVPFRVLRGGRLLGGRVSVTLRGALLRRSRWSFASDAGWQMDARVVNTRRSRFGEGWTQWRLWFASKAEDENLAPRSSEPEVEVEPPKPLGWFKVELERPPLVYLSPDLSMLLALGCWLLIEWRSMPLPVIGGGG